MTKMLRLTLSVLLLTAGITAYAAEIDRTGAVGTAQSSWVGASGLCAIKFAPAVSTQDGRTDVQMVEKYESTTATTGILLEQTISGLPNGNYKVVIYANAFHANGVDGDATFSNGAMDIAYVFASDKQAAVSAASTNSTTKNGEYTLEGVTVTNGTLKLGLGKNKAGTNWHTIQIKSLVQIVDDFTSPFADGDYYLKNVASGRFWAAGNQYGSQASLIKHGDYVTFKKQTDGTYSLQGRLNREGNIYFNNGYMDGAFSVVGSKLIIAPIAGTSYYTISNGSICYGYDGSSTVLASNLTADNANAQWEIIPVADMKASLTNATAEAPLDATFLIQDPNFSRYHVGKSIWKMEAGNQNLGGGANDNHCAESYHSTFTLTQSLTGLHKGIYSLTAQGFYRNDNGATDDIPVFYAGTATMPFFLRTGTENDMAAASASFSNGAYKIEPIYVAVTTDNATMNIGARLQTNTSLWCIFDNFELTYYGDCTLNQAKFAGVTKEIYPLIEEATPYETIEDCMSNAVRQEVINAIDNANTELENADTSVELLERARDRLSAAIADAKASIKAYDYLEREMVAARDVQIDNLATYEAILTSGSSTTEQVTLDAQNVNVAVYNKVQSAYNKSWAFTTAWTGEIGTASGQHWSGNTSISYYDTNGTNITRSLTNSLTLPAGDYVFMAAGRSEANAEMKLEVGSSVVIFTAKGDTGYGINTNGYATFSADSTYANGGVGRGWEWAYVYFHLDTESTINLKGTITTSGWAWGSFTDFRLQMDDATFNSFAYKFLDEALEKYKPFTESGDYVTEYNEIKANRENHTYATSDEIDAAVENLKTSYATYLIENASLDRPADMTEGVILNADCRANDAWTGSGRTPATGEHWSGDASRAYFAQNHEEGAARTQTITLPAYSGLYIVKSSVRIPSAGYAEVTVGSRSTRTTQITGRTGGTIATDGTEWESVAAGIAAGKSFANSNNGYGWIYNYVYFYAEASTTVDISLALSNVNNGREANVGSVQLLYCGQNSNYTEVAGNMTTMIGKYTKVPTITTANVNTTGAVLPASTTLTSSNPNMLIYANAGQVANAKNVIVDGTCANLVLTDGHPFIATTGFTATAASYSMTAIASNGTNSFGTLCLPFAVTSLPDKAYELTEEVTMNANIKATKVTSITANTPVLVTATGTYSGSGAVQAVESGKTFTSGQLVGGYTQTTAPAKSYVLQKHGSDVAFYIVGDTKPTVNPFRAYIKEQTVAEAMIRVDFEDGTTGILNATAVEKVEVERYNAAGLPITAPQKGLNIVRYSDGSVRKVIVK